MTDRRPALRARLIAGAILTVIKASQLWAADPFYIELLETGKQALRDGTPGEAALDLEIACFGFLDEPTLLADGLSHLALAQSRSGDDEGLDETLERLLTLEEGHRAYSEADIAAGTRNAVEQVLAGELPAERLAEIEAFRPLAKRAELVALAAMGPDERRRVLTQRLARDPGDVRSLQLLADLEVAEGNAAAALPHLDALVALSGGEPATVCRRFQAAIDAGDCSTSLGDLEACPEEARRVEQAPRLLQCMLDGDELERASRWAASLEPDVRSSAKTWRLVKQLDRRLAAAERAAASATIAETGEAGQPEGDDIEPEEGGDSAAAPGPATPADAQSQAPAPDQRPSVEQLRAARRQLEQARSSNDLGQALAVTAELADTYPDSAEAQFLAAEAAYRAAQWETAVRRFDAGGDPGTTQPLLLFYKAVALFETGDVTRAADYLQRALPHVRKTPFVRSYTEKIMAATGESG